MVAKTEAKKAPAPESLKSKVGAPPVDDSLAAISWMQRALAEMAGQVMDDARLTQSEKREEMLKIADRMAKLRDPDRIYRAEQSVRTAKDRRDEPKPGPQLKDAPSLDTPTGQLAARRGRPPKRALS